MLRTVCTLSNARVVGDDDDDDLSGIQGTHVERERRLPRVGPTDASAAVATIPRSSTSELEVRKRQR